MTLARVDNHVEDGLRLPLAQFRGLPVFEALLSSLLKQVQEIEDALWDVLVRTQLPLAAGVQLDRLGRIVGQPRQGRGDESYRIWIAARVMVNRSSGLAEQVIAIVEKLVEGKDLELREEPPAAFTIDVQEPITELDGVEIAKILQRARAAGVRGLLEWFSEPIDEVFAFSDDGTEVFDDLGRGLTYGALASVSDGEVT